ncbi:hypothetical protein J3R82DRAFT_8013 [Butyriboletus roseoflavus]|nr:hypothetical protein J3R82DRAFT_8013 [Butyriboletus roseoflavus]
MSLANLHSARLSDVYNSIQSFDVPLPQPPVIWHDKDNREALPGLRFLREEVKRDCDVLDRFTREDANSSTPSANAPYLIAVWGELVHARQPVAIYRTFSPANGQDRTRGKAALTSQERTTLKSQTRSVKVDVVAENGARWVRVNTTNRGPCLAQTEFDNSVLRMGRELLAAAKANRVLVPTPLSNFIPDLNSTSTIMTPQVTIRLTRLDPSLEDDPRIEKTIQYLRDMGIDVQLGERSYLHPTPTKLKLLEPTANINLDLSALIALISDISHSPLPRTEQEAHARFEPPQSYFDWKKDRAKSLTHQSQSAHHSLYDVEDSESDEGTWDNSGTTFTRARSTGHTRDEQRHSRRDTRTHIGGRHATHDECDILDDERGTSSMSPNRLHDWRGEGEAAGRCIVRFDVLCVPTSCPHTGGYTPG